MFGGVGEEGGDFLKPRAAPPPSFPTLWNGLSSKPNGSLSWLSVLLIAACDGTMGVGSAAGSSKGGAAPPAVGGGGSGVAANGSVDEKAVKVSKLSSSSSSSLSPKASNASTPPTSSLPPLAAAMVLLSGRLHVLIRFYAGPSRASRPTFLACCLCCVARAPRHQGRVG